MKKLIYLFILAIGFTSCSVESIDSTENLLVADAVTAFNAKSFTFQSNTICQGTSPVFEFTHEQNTERVNVNPNQGQPIWEDQPINTEIKIDMWNPALEDGEGDWEFFATHVSPGTGSSFTPESFDFAAREYSFRAQIDKGQHLEAYLTVEDCCEESFSYVDNGDGTYTFTYKAGEDMDNAELVFTFAQGAYVSGLGDAFSQNGNGNGQTYKANMVLEKCDVLQYIVTLNPKCLGGSKTSNVWTDFTVNTVSKKAHEDDKFEASCPGL